jgi:hypothetical protein
MGNSGDDASLYSESIGDDYYERITFGVGSIYFLAGKNDLSEQTAFVVSKNSMSVQTSGYSTFEGVRYDADYSANFVDRSLVDKGYVDAAIAGVGGLPSQTGNAGKWLTTNGTTASWNALSGNVSLFTNDAGYITSSALTGYTPTSRTLTINGTTYDLTANRSWSVGDILSSGSYANPSWITSLAASKITGTLPIANGGTNSGTALSNNRVMKSAGGAIVEAAAITAARVLISDANGIPTHSTVTDTTLGYLDATSSIQTQLNAKQATITGAATTITTSDLTASRTLISNSSGKVAVSTTTDTELGYVSGVTSSIQTQLNAKQATITGGATTIASSNLTASRALVSDGSGKVGVSTVTDTELGYVSGATSNIQTQITNLAGQDVETFFTNTATGMTVNAGATRYYPIDGVFGVNTVSVNTNICVKVPKGGTLQSYNLRTTTSQPAGGSLTFTIQTGAAPSSLADTSMVITVAAGSAAGDFTTANTATLTDGYWICQKMANGSGSASASITGTTVSLKR